MPTRRRILIASLLAAAGAIVWAGAAYTTGSGHERTSGVRQGEGVGMYTDASTANQASTFTIDRDLVSCGVGGPDLGGLGPFEMLMYSTRIRHYRVDHSAKEITARGEMRSITRVGGAVVEDVRHSFIAHAVDSDETR